MLVECSYCNSSSFESGWQGKAKCLACDGYGAVENGNPEMEPHGSGPRLSDELCHGGCGMWADRCCCSE